VPLKSTNDSDTPGAPHAELQRALTEALEQQTATAEILRVISSSPTDVQPVYDSIVERAARLCGAEVSLVARLEGEWIHVGAVYGTSVAGTDALRRTYPMRPGAEGATARAIRDSAITHIPDVLTDRAFTIRDAALTAGFRAVLSVPMLRDGRAIGAISIGRAEAGEFSIEQVNLLRTFADQAVIAIENVRLFKELEGRNRDLTATSEILRVISSSPTDVQPVFDTILESATRLCAAENGILFQYVDGVFHTVACRGLSAEAEAAFRGQPARPGPQSGLGRMLAERRPVHVEDVTDDVAYRLGDPLRMRTATLLGARTAMWLPLLKNDVVIGALAIYRREVRPFADKQIELIRTFADQAVIAIENVRLFKELDTRNAELTDTLARQTATGEVLRAISRAQTDAKPVFDIIAESAVRLCAARVSTVTRFDGEWVHLEAVYGPNPEGIEAVRRSYPMRATNGASGQARAMRDRAIVHIPDVLADPSYGIRDAALASGFRAVLVVPMLLEGHAIGGIAIGRTRRALSLTIRSSSCRPSPTRPSSPSRTCACSRSWKRRTRHSHKPMRR
jgi:GAF domain-containing protein